LVEGAGARIFSLIFDFDAKDAAPPFLYILVPPKFGVDLSLRMRNQKIDNRRLEAPFPQEVDH